MTNSMLIAPLGLEPLVTDGIHTKALILSYAGGAASFFYPLAGLLIGKIAIFSDIGLYLNDIFTSTFDTEVIQTALFSTLDNLGWFTLGYTLLGDTNIWSLSSCC